MSRRVLVVQHEQICPPGRVGRWLVERGIEVDVVRPYAGEGLPDDLHHDGLVVLGGTMSANEDELHAWLPSTKRLLLSAVHDSTPALGLCLGHQLLAMACGGRVEPNPQGTTAGLRSVRMTTSNVGGRGDPLFDDLPRPAVAVHWNDDVVTALPPNSVVLASTTDGWPQVIRVGERAWGVQFHPEADRDIVSVWAERTVEAGDLNRAEADARLDEITSADADLRSTWRGWTERFARLVLS